MKSTSETGQTSPSFQDPNGGHVYWDQTEPPIATYRARHKIWLVPNTPGTLWHDPTASCFSLDCALVFFPANPPAPLTNPKKAIPKIPRVPLLGLAGLEPKKLQLAIDCEKRLVNLTAP